MEFSARLRSVSFRTAFLAALLIWSVHTALLVSLAQADVRTRFASLTAPVFGLLGAASLWHAGRQSARARSPQARAWQIWALACLAWMVGDLIWTYLELAAGQSPPPSLADLFYGAFFLLFFVGALHIPRRQLTSFETRKLILDISIFTVVVAVAQWLVVTGLMFEVQAAEAAEIFVLISYPVAGLLSTWLPLVVILQRLESSQSVSALLLLAFGTALLWGTSIVFILQTLTETVFVGSLLDAGWSGSFMIFALAGWRQAQLVAVEHASTKLNGASLRGAFAVARVLLPYAGIGAAYLLFVVALGRRLPLSFDHIALIAGLIIVLTLLRQTITLLENAQLLARLQQLNAELENRVEERTRELTRANEQLRQEIAERERIEQALRASEEQLYFDATHDSLTGLPNRLWFMDRLEHALQLYRRQPEHQFAVLFLDVDGFKAINDSLGHSLGDRFLIAVAQRLQASLRAVDTAARMGGDEFVILIENIGDVVAAAHVAERIQREMTATMELAGYRLFMSVSIGLVLSAPEYSRAEDLLRDADIALYRAKALGKAGYQIFDPALRVQAAARLEIETALREALERDEFSLYYQPILSLRDERLTGFEALLRWRRPGHGLIPPLDFIPLAEETGLIVPIGYWTLREACRQLKVWQQAYPVEPPLTVNVNISSRQLTQPGFTEQVALILAEAGLAGRCLKLEITENVFIHDAGTVSGILGQLRAMGVEVQIDDFGTGYSNLGYLHQLPISALKISQTFVNEVSTDRSRAEILQAVVTLAHNLGMSVVVEGVETAEQMAHIREMRCEEGQGYFICRPMDRDQATAYLSRRSLPGAEQRRQ